ncbi:flagellar biosynthetic protein FliO [Halorhodospira halophila]|uniref:Flagellar protein n=1 Tax=Halorhodospira halophila (strain DSM 244 / SL1) TaxID=349124 RepID=A1WUB0_HALHL|nr:flagellar biosynthetic protein FliO [Halorhodospira halophila]ABM61272.1 flagellar biosynthesis protein, FliO [Halorhodospira halophila SL1]MBK1729146.1 flagellar biosynthetic protein FliO [Halorhodospira halophila]
MALRLRSPASLFRRPRRATVALGVNLLALPAPAWAETVPGVEAEAIARVIVALLVVLAVIIGLAWLLRRFGGGAVGGTGQMRVLGSLPVGQRERVVLVQVGDTQLLLGVAPGRVQTLHVLETPVTGVGGETGDGQGGPFAARLRRLMQQSDQQ